MGERHRLNIALGRWTEESLDELIRCGSTIQELGERIDLLSSRFLDTPYGESTLIGDILTPEILTVNLSRLDCFTFLDYVEAMRRSSSYADFLRTLQDVRYKDSEVAYQKRNHFFTDWREQGRIFIDDITGLIGGCQAIRSHKTLNRKEDGSLYLEGIPEVEREILYVPDVSIEEDIVKKLRTGDYLGIYADMAGLDVSHVGIFIRKRKGNFFRHASSQENYRKVIDEVFCDYLKGKPGIIVFRPRLS